MKSKVGILTWSSAINYGARAHSIALYSKVKEMGYEVEIIKYSSLKAIKYEIRGCISKNLINLVKGVYFWYKFKTRKEEAKYSKRFWSEKGINKAGYDSIILGSDEIFNPTHPCFSKIYMGVGLDCPHIITYAVSSGQVSNDYKLDEECISAIKKINNISVRDSYTKEYILTETGIRSNLVLDPTFLWDARVAIDIDEKYILIYAFKDLTEIKDKILKYAYDNNLKTIRIGKCTIRGEWADENYGYVSQERWYAYFKNAYIIITDSFHGVVYSIKNKKNFVVIPLNEKINKIECLLTQLDIKREFYSKENSFDEYVNEGVDYSRYEENYSYLVNQSIDYLRSNILNA